MHIKYPLSPIKIYVTKPEVEQYKDRLDFINITEIGEAQAMKEMVRYEYINNLHNLSTDIMRMHMDPEFWYQQQNLDRDTLHLNNHMIEMVQKYMRGDATQMKTYIHLGAVVCEFKHCKEIFARSKLTMEAIRSMHADFYDLPDSTRYNTSADSSNKGKILEEEIAINDCEQSLRTIIADHLTNFELRGDGYPVHQPESPPHVWAESIISRLGRWAGGGECQLRGCDYQIEQQPSHSGGVFERDMRPM
jgi:hypothetical protein